MTKYTFPHSVLMSFWSSKLYHNVYHYGQGTGFMHSALCIFFVSLLSYATLIAYIDSYKNTEKIDELYHIITSSISGDKPFEAQEQLSRLAQITSQFPPLEIKDNKLISTKKMPVNIYDPFTHELLVSIDTSQTAHNFNDSESVFLLLEDAFVVNKTPHGERVISPFKSFPPNQITRLNSFFAYASSLPDFTIKNDKMHMQSTSPHIIYAQHSTNTPLIAFDNTDITPATSPIYKRARIVFTPNTYYLRTSALQQDPSNNDATWLSGDYSELTNENLYTHFVTFIPTVTDFLTQIYIPQNAPLMLITSILSAFAFTALLSLFNTAIARIIFTTTPEFKSILRITSIAITPAIILLPLFIFTKLFFPNLIIAPFISLFLITLLYCLFATISSRPTLSTTHQQMKDNSNR